MLVENTHFDFPKFFDLLKNYHDPLVIKAEIKENEKRFPSLAARMHFSNDQTAQTEKKELQEINEKLNLLLQFLTWCKNQSVVFDFSNEETQKTYQYKVFGDFLESDACELGNKKLVAVQCWRQCFEKLFSKEKNPKDIIACGAEFYYESEKFAAFLILLLEKNIKPSEIIDSRLLHRFYYLHYGLSEEAESESALKQVYAYLANFKEFIELISNTPANLVGVGRNIFLKSKLGFESFALSGEKMQHETEITTPLENNPTLSPIILKNHTTIFQLFDFIGMNVIGYLDQNLKNYKTMFQALLRKHEKEILRQLPGIYMSGEISSKKLEMLIKLIAENIESKEKMDRILAISPFYIILFFEKTSLLRFVDNEKIFLSFKALIDNEAITENLLKIFIGMVDFFKLYPENLTGLEIARLERDIFNRVIASDFLSMLDDHLVEGIKRFSMNEELCKEKLNAFLQELNTAFKSGNPYFSVNNKWGELLSQINFIKKLYPYIVKENCYPFDAYQRDAFILEKMVSDKDGVDASLFDEMLSHFPNSNELAWGINIFLEALVSIENEKITKILQQKLEAHRKEIKQVVTDDKVLSVLKIAELNCRPETVDFLYTFTRDRNMTNASSLDEAVMNGQCTHVKAFCESVDVKPSQENISNALMLAGTWKQWGVVIYLSALTGDNAPDKTVISSVVGRAVSAKRWDVVAFLFNLQGNNKPSQNAAKDALTYALRERQWDVFKLIFKLSGDNKLDQSTASEVLKDREASRWPHIVKFLCELPGNDKANKKAVETAFVNATQRNDLETMGFLCSIVDDRKLNQEIIFSQLKESAKYENSFRTLKFLCKRFSDTAANKAGVSAVLKQAVLHDNNEGVKFLCELTEENKPTQEAVSKVLVEAQSKRNWEIVEFLCALPGDNRPDQKTVDWVLRRVALNLVCLEGQDFFKIFANVFTIKIETLRNCLQNDKKLSCEFFSLLSDELSVMHQLIVNEKHDDSVSLAEIGDVIDRMTTDQSKKFHYIKLLILEDYINPQSDFDLVLKTVGKNFTKMHSVQEKSVSEVMIPLN